MTSDTAPSTLIQSARIKNFRILRDVTVPLGPFTVIVGPNSSGKSTLLRALRAAGDPPSEEYRDILTFGVHDGRQRPVEVVLDWATPAGHARSTTSWVPGECLGPILTDFAGPLAPSHVKKALGGIQIYSLDPRVLVRPVGLSPRLELGPNGENFAGVLDRLRDEAPERFEALNQALGRVIPEFDRILFEVPSGGARAFALRSRRGGQKLAAPSLSHGTVLAFAILTLAHLPQPPSLIGLKDPDRGLHPRLLRDLQDVLYTLSFPRDAGDARAPVQVIVTTHSPYFLDLYKEHPSEVLIAERTADAVQFARISDRADLDKLLGETGLGDAWFSGVLGGVPPTP